VLAAAVHDGRVVSFDYRGPSSGREPARRTVEPWGLVAWHGRWYLVGHDRDRDDTRVFRLSRVQGTPKTQGAAGAVTRPPGLDLTAAVSAYDAAAPVSSAVVRVRVGRGLGLRRLAGAAQPAGEGWDVVDVPFTDAERLADAVLPYGDDVVVSEPPEAVAVVVRRLRALAGSSDVAGAPEGSVAR
jgi:proteasome accessory factor B